MRVRKHVPAQITITTLEKREGTVKTFCTEKSRQTGKGRPA